MASRARAGHKTEQREQHIAPAPEEVSQQSPLDFTLAFMRDDSKSDALRATMAKAALPYLHKRGQEHEQERDDATDREQMSDLELARRIAHILMLGEKQQNGEAAQKVAMRSCGEDAAPRPAASTAPHLDDERAQRNDRPDPHPAYRWIP